MSNDAESPHDSRARSLMARIVARFGTSSDRRRASRFTVPDGCLCAYYWEGGAPTPHPILNVSEAGAYFETATVWRNGTIIELALQRKQCDNGAPSDPAELVRVAAKVWRCEQAGTAVEFIYMDPRERQHMRTFLAEVRAGGRGQERL
jgi:hypothetical protein